jgi:predicted RNase H-like HicB family nuclease
MSDLKDYLELAYTVLLRKDTDGDFVAKIEELPGCAAHGKTREEALANLDEAKMLWIQDCLENGDTVPPPEEGELPSGKWLQRVPRKLHRKLQLLSRREGVSLNQYVLAVLAEAVGEGMARSVEQPPWYSTENYGTLPGYFVSSTYELVPPEFQVLDVTSVKTRSSREELLKGLAHLSGQLPDRIELKSKVNKKDDDKKHSGFQVCRI